MSLKTSCSTQESPVLWLCWCFMDPAGGLSRPRTCDAVIRVIRQGSQQQARAGRHGGAFPTKHRHKWLRGLRGGAPLCSAFSIKMLVLVWILQILGDMKREKDSRQSRKDETRTWKRLEDNRACLFLQACCHLVLYVWLILCPFQCEQRGLILSPTQREKKNPTALLVFFCPGFMGRAPDRQREAAACNVMWTVTVDASRRFYSVAERLHLSRAISPKCLCLNSGGSLFSVLFPGVFSPQLTLKQV